jgi:hypothetical protein
LRGPTRLRDSEMQEPHRTVLQDEVITACGRKVELVEDVLPGVQLAAFGPQFCDWAIPTFRQSVGGQVPRNGLTGMWPTGRKPRSEKRIYREVAVDAA